MPKIKSISLEQIDKYLADIKHNESILIPYGDNIITVKPALTRAEKKTFIDRVVENSYVNNTEFSPLFSRITFNVTFAQMFTDIPIPTEINNEDTIDIDRLCNIVDGLDLIDYSRDASPTLANTLNELKMCINQEINFKNQKLISLFASDSKSNDALEITLYIANRILDGVNKFCDILDNVKDLTQDGKFLKVIPKKKLDNIFGWIQEIVNGFIESIRPINNNTIKFNKEEK